jgi:anti-anti-sigma factor
MTVGFETGEERLEGGVPMFWVAGELDLATRNEIENRLLELADTQPALILDLRRCTFVDSSALGLVAQLYRRLADRNGHGPSLALLVGGESVRKVLELAALDRILPICADPEAALAALGRA